MEKSQLVTIAVTAVISVTMRELLSWAVTALKSKVAHETTRAKARKIFNKHTRVMMLFIFLLATSIWSVVSDIRKTTPISRMDIFWISLGLTNISLLLIVLTIVSALAFMEYKSKD
jgi:hypothetical protein